MALDGGGNRGNVASFVHVVREFNYAVTNCCCAKYANTITITTTSWLRSVTDTFLERPSTGSSSKANSSLSNSRSIVYTNLSICVLVDASTKN